MSISRLAMNDLAYLKRLAQKLSLLVKEECYFIESRMDQFMSKLDNTLLSSKMQEFDLDLLCKEYTPIVLKMRQRIELYTVSMKKTFSLKT